MSEHNFFPFPNLQTTHLLLRQVNLIDAPEIFSLRSSELVNKYLDRKPSNSIEDALVFIQAINENIQKNQSIYWAITLPPSNKLVGTICLFNFSPDQSKAEMGFELLPPLQGKGIMMEAASRIIQYGFGEIGLTSIEATTHPGNVSSRRLLEKLNFELTFDEAVAGYLLKKNYQAEIK